jgi:hypothetical protein
MTKACISAGSGRPLGRRSWPPYLKGPTTSRFLVSTLITGLLGSPRPVGSMSTSHR